MTSLATYPAQVLTTIIRPLLAARPSWAYIKPSWILAFIQIESSFQPLVINASGRQDGLMQVIPATAAQMASLYGIASGPQTDPATSVASGTAYIDYCARKLIADLSVPNIPLSQLVEAYNEGEAAAEKGLMVPTYWADWSDAQAVFSADGADSANAVTVTT